MAMHVPNTSPMLVAQRDLRRVCVCRRTRVRQGRPGPRRQFEGENDRMGTTTSTGVVRSYARTLSHGQRAVCVVWGVEGISIRRVCVCVCVCVVAMLHGKQSNGTAKPKRVDRGLLDVPLPISRSLSGQLPQRANRPSQDESEADVLDLSPCCRQGVVVVACRVRSHGGSLPWGWK
jgi:hypothetical protein